ncbi:MAG: GNAT family N-acetyltransferase [Acidobacteria bacterium]|nr:MAG: GNAT family N-acetyltransferase [Acidobacteriota bacterium]
MNLTLYPTRQLLRYTLAKDHPPGDRERKDLRLTSEIVDIRHFEARDFASLLEAESRVWGADLRWDYTASARLISTCLEEKRLSGYALVKERRIEGYSFFFYEQEKALIGDLFVQSDGAGLEQALLLIRHVIETLLATPGLRRVEAQLPHFGFEDLDASFSARGFKGYLRRFMALPLQGHAPSVPTPVLGPHQSRWIRAGSGPLSDFVIAPWQRKHDRQAAHLLYHAYRGHVDAAINDQYSSVEGTARLIENIVHHRGCGRYLPESSLAAFHRPSWKLAGILALTAVRPSTAHIPQVAIAREFQGRGLGTAMMGLSFAGLAKAGYREVSLTVTDLNAGAVELYERLGFGTFRQFGAFVWEG